MYLIAVRKSLWQLYNLLSEESFYVKPLTCSQCLQNYLTMYINRRVFRIIPRGGGDSINLTIIILKHNFKYLGQSLGGITPPPSNTRLYVEHVIYKQLFKDCLT